MPASFKRSLRSLIFRYDANSSTVLSTADAQFLQPHKEHSSPSVIIALKGSTIWLHWNYSYVGDTEKNKCKEQLVYCIGCHGVRAILRRKGATADLKHRVDRPGALPGIPAYLVNRIKVFPNNDSIAMRNMTLSDAGVYFVSVVYLEVKNETNNQTRVLAVLLQPIKIKIVVLGKALVTRLWVRLTRKFLVQTSSK